MKALTEFDQQFGMAMADRLGLPHDMTFQEWSYERLGSKNVIVRMEVFHVMTEAELSDLRRVATARAAEKEQ